MLKKTVHRPNHRERAQPLEREKWGVLEKHKDYSLRARDFQEKKKRLKILQQKAAERNPDEFRYGMLSSRSKEGKKIAERGNLVLSQEAVKLLKTQDSGYLRTMIQKTRRAIEKLEREFVLVEGQGAEVLGKPGDLSEGQHTVFVDSKEEQKQYTPGIPTAPQSYYRRKATNLPQQSEGDRGGVITESRSIRSETIPKSRCETQREAEAAKRDKVLRKQHKREQDARRAKLTALRDRMKNLVDAENELELQRAKMSNNVGGVTKAGVKWRPRERKR